MTKKRLTNFLKVPWRTKVPKWRFILSMGLWRFNPYSCLRPRIHLNHLLNICLSPNGPPKKEPCITIRFVLLSVSTHSKEG
jgi:hypothetical protein